MKRLPIMLLLVVAVLAQADDIEPAVRTSSVGAQPAAVPTQAAPARSATGRPAAAATRPGAAAAPVRDRIDLDATQITGNRELPNVMYVVPWKKPDLGDFAGRPPKSLLDELLAPVDREVFHRENRYFSALQPDAATPLAAPVPPASLPAAGGAITLPAGDEK